MSNVSLSHRRITVLMVDDQAVVGEVMRRMLAEEPDIDFHYCQDPTQALKMAARISPTVILQDLVMPGISGLTLVRWLRAYEVTRDIPVIVLSGKEDAETKVEAFALGASDYMVKLPDRLEVIARIRHHSMGYINLLERNIAERELVKARDANEPARQELEEANTRIMDSIDYALTIQSAILPKKEDISKHVGECFITWKPKDIIGGDLFWFDAHQDGSFLLAVIDCTGHGVPGALMTMVAAATLDRVVHEVGSGDPALILRKLNVHVQRALHQHSSGSHSDDGMDMGLCHVDLAGRMLTYAGARISLFYNKEGEIQEVRGDRQSIGYKASDVGYIYTNHGIPLDTSMSFYMSTDGLIDQVGDPLGFPFGKRRFRSFLAEHCREALPHQEALLMKALEEYRGKEAQRDDILVIGFSI